MSTGQSQHVSDLGLAASKHACLSGLSDLALAASKHACLSVRAIKAVLHVAVRPYVYVLHV